MKVPQHPGETRAEYESRCDRAEILLCIKLAFGIAAVLLLIYGVRYW